MVSLQEKDYLYFLKEFIQGEEIKEKVEKIETAKSFCKFLEEHDIKYDLCIRHKEVLGCLESEEYYERFSDYLPVDYSICKNLLVHERKGDKRTFLIITDSNKEVDLASIRETLDCKKLEFVSAPDMKELLHTVPGNVSLFNMIYDEDKKVELVIDEDLLTYESLAFHPLYNGMSLFLSPVECLKFLKVIKRDAFVIPLKEKTMEKQLLKSQAS